MAMSKLATILLTGLSAEENAVFDKATPTLGWPEYGIDCDGRIIKRSEYGQTSAYGWHKDHTLPKALGGADHISNYRPRHWLGNTRAGGALRTILSG
jgi:hypothetical protein